MSTRFTDARRRWARFGPAKVLRVVSGAALCSVLGNQSVQAATDSEGVEAEGTCRILAIRVQFPVEAPDELTTTGNGRFDLRPLSEALSDYVFPYDTPPHDRTYFEQHLEALADYYHVVSDGRLAIEYTVLPRDPDSAYELPLSGLTYGNGRSTEEVGEKWLQFARHAVAKADSDSTASVQFSDFDSFLLIHPGQGQESGEINDIRSVFLSQQDLRTYDGGSPLTADGGQFELPHIWIVPETSDSFGRAGLNGLLAKFFGFVLGLPSLSNGARGTAALGTWSLMDAGATALGWVRSGEDWRATFGFLPPHPMAWSKARLGWIEPLIVRRDTTVKIVASDRLSRELPKAVRVPISDDEYFLLENRQQRGHFGVPAGVDPPFEGFDDILWLSEEEIGFSHTLTAEDVAEAPELVGRGAGVWTSTAAGDYDAFIPGSGILIWHVDETVIEAQFDAGVNNDRGRPGIALEEADGFHHIGNVFFDQQHLAEGTPDDPFYAGLGPGGISGVTTFGSDTVPPTLSNDGIETGIEIEILSELADTMEVAIRFGKSRSGWPKPAQVSRRLQAADFGGTGASSLIVEDETGLHVMSPEGTLWSLPGASFAAAAEGSGNSGGTLFSFAGEVVSAFDGASIAASSAGEPAWQVDLSAAPTTAAFAADLGLFPGTPVLIAGTNSSLLLLDAASGQRLRTVEIVAGALSVADLDGDGAAELTIASEDGSSGFILSSDGLEPAWSEQGRWFGPVAGDLDADGLADLVIISDSGTLIATGVEGELFTRSTVGEGRITSAPALGDVDGDGFLEIVAATSAGLNVTRANGLPQANFPTIREGAALLYEPALADLDADGRLEIFAASLNGIMAFDDNALPLAGFPLLTESILSWAPVVADADGDGALDLAAAAGDEIYLWDLNRLSSHYNGSAVSWGQSGRGAAGLFSHPPLGRVPGVGAEVSLLPQQQVYCYPNPAGPEELLVHIRFFLSRAADLKLDVFDVLGERIKRVRVGNESMQVAAENEIEFSAAELASGLYICQLEATGLDGERATAVVKMAVSR